MSTMLMPECVRTRRSYKSAIAKYTAAINVHCDVPDVAAAPYANRAAVELKLGNYQRALADSESALKWQPHNVKARYRYVYATVNYAVVCLSGTVLELTRKLLSNVCPNLNLQSYCCGHRPAPI